MSSLCVLGVCALCEILGSSKRLSNSVVFASTVFKLCRIFKLKLERASKEPENYIILSIAKRKYIGKRLSKPPSGE